MLELGLVSAILPENTFEEVVDFAANNRFQCIEMMCWPQGKAERRYAGVTHIDVDQLSKTKIDHIKNYLNVRSVYISALGYYPNPLTAEKKQSLFYIDHIKKVIKAANALDIPIVNTFVGRDHTRSLEYNLDCFVEVWPEIIQFADKNSVKVAIENCPMRFTEDEWPGGKNLAISPAIWDKMFNAIPSPNFGLNYDPSHLVWQQMDEIKPIYDYAEKLIHIHLKDVKVYQDKLNRVGMLAHPLEYHSPKIPGHGDVRWGDFFSALTSVGYMGAVCVEVEDKAFEGSIENIHKAIRISRNYLNQFLDLT